MGLFVSMLSITYGQGGGEMNILAGIILIAGAVWWVIYVSLVHDNLIVRTKKQELRSLIVAIICLILASWFAISTVNKWFKRFESNAEHRAEKWEQHVGESALIERPRPNMQNAEARSLPRLSGTKED